MSDQLPPPPAPGTAGWSPVGPYATSTAAVPPMRSLRGLAIALLVLFTVVALVDVVGAAALFNRAGLIEDLLTSDPPSFSEGEDADSAVAGALGTHLFLMLALAVVFIIWQWRHAKNAETMGQRGGLGPGWAIGGWFIPLANFVLPGVQIFQSSKASDRQARSQGRRGKGAGIVIAWAIAFGLANVLLAASGNIGETDDEGNLVFDTVDDVETAADSDRLGGAGLLLMIPASALGAIMVWTLSKRQAEAYAAMAAATTATLSAPPATAFPPPATGAGDSLPDWPQQSDQPGPPPPPPAVPSAPSSSGPEGWGTAPGAGSPASSAPPPPPPLAAGATPSPPIPPPPGAPDAGQDPAPPGTEPGLDPASSADEDSTDVSVPEDEPAGPGGAEDQPGWAAPSAPGTERPPPPPPAPPS